MWEIGTAAQGRACGTKLRDEPNSYVTIAIGTKCTRLASMK